MISPVGRTASSASTYRFVVPYLNALGPPAHSATLPPIADCRRLAGSGGWSSFNASAPYDASAEGSLKTNGPPVMPVTRSMKPDGSGATLPCDGPLPLPLLDELEDASGPLSQTIERRGVRNSEETW